jgi:heme/copper-type cytochrome/quinol oxidase subunit 3
VTELAQHSTDYSVVEAEPPEIMGRNLRVGAHLWASATVFFFFAFLFAYFYLRSVNQQGLWHPHGVKAPVALGTLIAASVAASALLTLFAARRLRAGDQGTWRAAGLGAFALGLLAVCLQVVQWWTIGFGPTDGGYASVFWGWTALFLLFLVCTLYWLETLLATSFRYRGQGASGHAPGEASGDPDRTGDDIARPISLIGPGVDAFAFYWSVLAGIGVVTWFILYIL